MGAADAQFLFRITAKEFLTRVVEFTALEGISSAYEVNVTFASSSIITFDDVAGSEAVLTVRSEPAADDEEDVTPDANRYFHGIIGRFESAGEIDDPGGGHPLRMYRAYIVPSLWFLSLKSNCRSFQNLTIEQIIGDVLKESGITSDRYRFVVNDKVRKLPPKSYCNQYRETDFNFICRLLEEAGIFFFFEHTAEHHILVMTDETFHCLPIAGKADVVFGSSDGMNQSEESVTGFNVSQQIRPGAYSHTSFNEQHPSYNLLSRHEGKIYQELELYDYTANYLNQERGKALARLRLESEKASKKKARGESCCPRLTPGYKFTLDDTDASFSGEYLLAAVAHSGDQPQSLDAHADGGCHYENAFICLPGNVKYRPPQITPRPLITGLQTALVVGSSGADVDPEHYLQVRVQFHWYREGKQKERCSCWIRVAQPWGGSGWGTQFVPRVGDEVLVAFLEGDPDSPVIVGSLYNEANRPLYDLPSQKTRSGIRTRSTPDGGHDNFNELSFEDRKGEEEVYLQAEKEWNILVKRDKVEDVRRDQSLQVGNDRRLQVGRNQHEAIGANLDQTIGAAKTESVALTSTETVGAAKLVTTGGMLQVTVGGVMNESVAGAKTEEVGAAKAVMVGAHMTENVTGKRSLTVGATFSQAVSETFSLEAKDVVIDAPQGVTINAGGVSLTMKDGKIAINGREIALKASGDIVIKGSKVATN